MTNWVLEILLDRYDPTPMEYNLVNISNSPATAGWFYQIQGGDSVSFQITDVTMLQANVVPTTQPSYCDFIFSPVAPETISSAELFTSAPPSFYLVPIPQPPAATSFVVPGTPSAEVALPNTSTLTFVGSAANAQNRFSLTLVIRDQNQFTMASGDPEIFIGPG